MNLEIVITEEGFTNVALDGKRIGLLKSVSLKLEANTVIPEISIEALKYDGMPVELSDLRKLMQHTFPWLTLTEIDPTKE